MAGPSRPGITTTIPGPLVDAAVRGFAAGYDATSVRQIAADAGLDPAVVTIYALRHSSIVRMLLQNVPIRLVASLHNTSVAMIEKNYSKYITEHSDDISRKALLQDEPPSGDNFVALAS